MNKAPLVEPRNFAGSYQNNNSLALVWRKMKRQQPYPEWFDVPRTGDLTAPPPPGPYMYLDSALKPVHRLYDDVQGALLTALKPKMPR